MSRAILLFLKFDSFEEIIWKSIILCILKIIQSQNLKMHQLIYELILEELIKATKFNLLNKSTLI
jgi:hypothetical protein